MDRRRAVPVNAGNAALARAVARWRGVSPHSSNAQLARSKTDMEFEARETARALGTRADELIERHRGHPDGLATAILGDLDGDGLQLADEVFDRIGIELAALLAAIAGAHDEAALGSATPELAQFLLTVARRLREVGNVVEAERLVGVLVSPAHAHLLGESAGASPAVQGALGPHGATLQSVKDGVGPVVHDEYWIVLDAMPPNLTPEQYLSEMSTDINRAVADETFDQINTFSRTQQDQQRGAPAVGDVVDIDFTGPDNGSVMLVEATPEHFIYQDRGGTLRPESFGHWIRRG